MAFRLRENLVSLGPLLLVAAVIATAMLFELAAVIVVVGLLILPTLLRTFQWFELAEKAGCPLTVLEGLHAFSAVACVCAWMGIALLTAFLLPAEMSYDLFPWSSLLAAGLCSYFLLGESWRFPQMYFQTHGRLPTWSELTAQQLRGLAVCLFVEGTWIVVIEWAELILPFTTVDPHQSAKKAGVTAVQILASVGTYRLATGYFDQPRVRLLAGVFLGLTYLGPHLAKRSYFLVDGWDLMWTAFSILFIILPYFRWPPYPRGRCDAKPA